MKAAAFRLGDLARRVGGRVRGDPDRVLHGIATLEDAGPDDLTFLTNPRYREAAARTRAGAVLVGRSVDLPGHDLLIADEPYLALALILEAVGPRRPLRPGIHPDARLGEAVEIGADVEVDAFAVVGSGARIGARASIGSGTVIGEDCEIGEDTRLLPRVVLYPRTRVGSRCILHSGVVLGADGFGFATSAGEHRKVPQLGRVVVEDDVEIGANTTVDRGALGDTVVGRGTKIDNLVMVAHGVRIGPGGLLAGQSGIAGSTRLGARVVLAGQSGAAGHLEIGDGVRVAAKSAVFSDVRAGELVSGIPAVDHRLWKKAQALFRRLPELRDRLRALEARVASIETRREE